MSVLLLLSLSWELVVGVTAEGTGAECYQKGCPWKEPALVSQPLLVQT